MNLEKYENLPDRQKVELDQIASPLARQIIIKLMGVTLFGFLGLSKDEMRLYIKFLIESVDQLEEESNAIQNHLNNRS